MKVLNIIRSECPVSQMPYENLAEERNSIFKPDWIINFTRIIVY